MTDELPPGGGRRRLGLLAGFLLLFVGATALFVQLLEPLAARPGDGAPAPAPAVAAVPVAPPVKPAPEATPAEPPAPAFDGPRIAIMLAELGPNAPAARRAIELLPPGVSLSFSPYAAASRSLAAAARDKGHEIWLSVPMQPRGYPRLNPGRNTLLTGNEPAENVRRLDWALEQVERPVGVTNMMGSAFTENAAALRPVLEALKARDLLFLDARSSSRSIAVREAEALGLPAAMNDRFLDEDIGAIDAHLAALELTARHRGEAIGYARATPQTLERLSRWAETLEEKGMKLVPASALTEG